MNDAQWHDVSILRYETNITFQIDSHFVRHFIPSEIGKLNIHFGIYIGGLGDFSITSVIDDTYFRGCIQDVSKKYKVKVYNVRELTTPLLDTFLSCGPLILINRHTFAHSICTHL